ncbi:MAG TPA: class I SAM-dependent methyltransferase [Rhizobiales bacterium]|nr:class I SAM-dependent methyltransferase [Hyphomicrobiales bacterium]
MTRTLTPEQARRYYERNAHKQDAQGWYEDAALERLIALGDFGNAEAVLEVGCGTGKLAELLLRDHMGAHATYIGVDISNSMLARAGTRLKHYLPRVKLSPADITLGLAASDATKDRIVATYVFDLLSMAHSRNLLTNMHRVLRPGGLICLAGLTRESEEAGMNVFSQLWTLIQRRWPWLAGGCRPVALRPLLDKTRWRIVAHETVAPRGLASEILIARKL